MLILSSCSTTKLVEKDEMLYTGVKSVVYEYPDSVDSTVKEQIEEAVNVKPNKYTITPSIRIPVGLWVYNHWNPEAKGLKGWLYSKLVEEPVLVSDVRPEVRTKMIDEILDDNGYFSGTSSFSLNQGKKHLSHTPSLPVLRIAWIPFTSFRTLAAYIISLTQWHLKTNI